MVSAMPSHVCRQGATQCASRAPRARGKTEDCSHLILASEGLPAGDQLKRQHTQAPDVCTRAIAKQGVPLVCFWVGLVWAADHLWCHERLQMG